MSQDFLQTIFVGSGAWFMAVAANMFLKFISSVKLIPNLLTCCIPIVCVLVELYALM